MSKSSATILMWLSIIGAVGCTILSFTFMPYSLLYLIGVVFQIILAMFCRTVRQLVDECKYLKSKIYNLDSKQVKSTEKIQSIEDNNVPNKNKLLFDGEKWVFEKIKCPNKKCYFNDFSIENHCKRSPNKIFENNYDFERCDIAIYLKEEVTAN